MPARTKTVYEDEVSASSAKSISDETLTEVQPQSTASNPLKEPSNPIQRSPGSDGIPEAAGATGRNEQNVDKQRAFKGQKLREEKATKAIIAEALKLKVSGEHGYAWVAYQIGVRVLCVKRSPGKYSKGTVRTLARALDMSVPAAYRYGILAERLTEADFDALLQCRNSKGLPPSVSYAEQFARESDSVRRKSLVDKRAAIDKCTVTMVRGWIDGLSTTAGSADGAQAGVKLLRTATSQVKKLPATIARACAMLSTVSNADILVELEACEIALRSVRKPLLERIDQLKREDRAEVGEEAEDEEEEDEDEEDEEIQELKFDY
jgi:hypothetical protein